MLAESPAPISRLDSLFCDAADTPSISDQYRPRRLKLYGRRALQDIHNPRTNSSIQACSSANNTPGICTLMQKAENLSLNSVRPPSRDALAKAVRACDTLFACCSPSPQPAAHNPKRKLYDSPAGDLTSKAATPSSALAGRRSRSMPHKRQCTSAATPLQGAHDSPVPTLRSCVSVPEPMMSAANACTDGPLSTPVGRAAALGATCMEYLMAGCESVQPSLLSTDQAAGAAAAGCAAVSAAAIAIQEDGLCSPAPMAVARTPAPPAKRRSGGGGCPPLLPPPPSLLPQIENASIGLPSIEPSTLAALITGDHSWGIDRAFVIDCRYNYEHNGGCVSGAVNMQDPTAVEAATVDTEASVDWGRTAVVFYCEFSSERAPRMFRHIRNLDRRLHLTSYPQLAVPNMYVMAGGYKAFQEDYPQLCTPRGGYVRMHDKRFGEELKEQHAACKAAWCSKDARRKTALPRHS